MKLHTIGIILLTLMFSGRAFSQYAEPPKDAPKMTVTKRGTEVASFKGSGEQTTKTFQLKAGTATFNILNLWDKHDPQLQKGEGKFSVVLQDEQGQHVDSVVGTFGHFDGARSIEISKAGNYKLKVLAPANWQVTIEQ